MKRLMAALLTLLMLVNPVLACAEESVVETTPVVIEEPAAEEPAAEVTEVSVEETAEEPVADETEESVEVTAEEPTVDAVDESIVEEPAVEPEDEPEMELVPTTVEDLAAAFGCESVEKLAEVLGMTVDA